MGSTGTHRERGMSDREFFENEFPTMLREHGRILACASKPAGGEWQRVFYAAVQNNEKASYAPGETWCLVVLMHTSRNPNTYFNFTYKDLSESMGPAEDECPTRILDLLSPTTSEYALEWRERCRRNAENAAKQKAVVAKVKSGAVIEFAQSLNFNRGAGEAKRFRVIMCGQRAYFDALDDQDRKRFTCRISRWRQRPFTIVTPSPFDKASQ